jgi:D-alanyl-D-alanine endopeptidase (penicillin-binding protein 7)
MAYQRIGMALIMLRASSFILALLLSTTVVARPITARSYMVTDDKGQVISEKNADRTQSIASITKLMTAIVVLNAHQDLNEELTLNFKNAKTYHTHLPRTLKTLSRAELLQLAIVKSDNFAAYTLAENYPGGVERAVAEMNHEALEFGMFATHFEDPTGLDEGNMSNARDLVKLVLVASRHTEITDASGKPQVKIYYKKRWWEFGNTNPLVKRGDDVIVSKTGYINASGGCVVMLLDTELGPRVIVLLGSKNTHTRIPEAEEISLTVSGKSIQVND